MPEEVLHVLEREALGEKEGGAGVAEVVEAGAGMNRPGCSPRQGPGRAEFRDAAASEASGVTGRDPRGSAHGPSMHERQEHGERGAFSLDVAAISRRGSEQRSDDRQLERGPWREHLVKAPPSGV